MFKFWGAQEDSKRHHFQRSDIFEGDIPSFLKIGNKCAWFTWKSECDFWERICQTPRKAGAWVPRWQNLGILGWFAVMMAKSISGLGLCTRDGQAINYSSLSTTTPSYHPQSTIRLSIFFHLSNFKIIFVGVASQYFFSMSFGVLKLSFLRCYFFLFNLIFFFYLFIFKCAF